MSNSNLSRFDFDVDVSIDLHGQATRTMQAAHSAVYRASEKVGVDVYLSEPGGDGEETSEDPDIDPARLRTPLDPETVLRAQDHAEEILEPEDRDLIQLLNGVQNYVDQLEYVDKPGNAFFEQLVEEFNDEASLRAPILVRDHELLCVLGGEGWADIQEALDLSDREVRAARDAHQLYAEDCGVAEYASIVAVIAVGTQPERVAHILKHSIPEPERVEVSQEVLATANESR